MNTSAESGRNVYYHCGAAALFTCLRVPVRLIELMKVALATLPPQRRTLHLPLPAPARKRAGAAASGRRRPWAAVEGAGGVSGGALRAAKQCFPSAEGAVGVVPWGF